MKNIIILYEDDFSIIINKPAGLAVQGGEGVKSSLDKIIAEYCSPSPLLVHRLDKDTSGILLAAKGREAAARFSRIFSVERKAVKLYTAVCAGSFAAKSAGSFAAISAGSFAAKGAESNLPSKEKGVITDKLMIRGKMKESKTGYNTVKTERLTYKDNEKNDSFEYSIVELELGTGRMHQIRRHLSMNGNPILGDDKYGDFKLNRKLNKSMNLKHLLLHASRLIIKELNIDVTCPPPHYFEQYI